MADATGGTSAKLVVEIARCASDAAHAIAMEANGSRASDEAVSDVARATARATGIVAEIAYNAARKAESWRIDSKAGDLGANYIIASVAADAAAAAFVTRKIADTAHNAAKRIESHGLQGEEAIGGGVLVFELSGNPERAADEVECAIVEAACEAVAKTSGRGTLAAVAADAAQAAATAVAQAAAAAAAGAAAARQIGDTRYRPVDGHGGDAEAAAAAVAKAIYVDPATRGPPSASVLLHNLKDGTPSREPAVAAALNKALQAGRQVDEALSAARAVAARADSDLGAALRFWNSPPR